MSIRYYKYKIISERSKLPLLSLYVREIKYVDRSYPIARYHSTYIVTFSNQLECMGCIVYSVIAVSLRALSRAGNRTSLFSTIFPQRTWRDTWGSVVCAGAALPMVKACIERYVRRRYMAEGKDTI